MPAPVVSVSGQCGTLPGHFILAFRTRPLILTKQLTKQPSLDGNGLDGNGVARMAHLARIGVTNEDLARYGNELGRILAFIEQINSVNTSGVEPLAHPLEEAQRMRQDEVAETDRRDDFQALAPKVEQGLYLVPRVLD